MFWCIFFFVYMLKLNPGLVAWQRQQAREQASIMMQQNLKQRTVYHAECFPFHRQKRIFSLRVVDVIQAVAVDKGTVSRRVADRHKGLEHNGRRLPRRHEEKLFAIISTTIPLSC